MFCSDQVAVVGTSFTPPHVYLLFFVSLIAYNSHNNSRAQSRETVPAGSSEFFLVYIPTS